MGRLLAALKRLEPEIPALQVADLAASGQSLPTVEASVDQTTDWESLGSWQDDSPANNNLAADLLFCDSVGEPIPVEQTFDYSTYEEINIPQAVETDGIFEQIEEAFEELSLEECQTEHDLSREDLCENRVEDFQNQETLDSKNASTTEAESVEPRPLAEVPAELGFVERLLDEEMPICQEIPAKTVLAQLEIVQPQAKKDRGSFSSMARNILAQLPTDEAVALFFTSPADSEGKTETILPLAEALIEESGLRTIVVDANLHRPGLTREWRFNSRRGIFDVLTGEADWWEAVQETGLPKLSILLNNGLPAQHAIVAQPLAFSELLQNLKREYRLVLIDAASLSHDESIPMVRHCQGVYLVVRLGHASPRTVREARQVIEQAGGKLLGCIAVGDVLDPGTA